MCDTSSCGNTQDKNESPLHQRFEFRNIRPEEAGQGITIEQTCFPPSEACSPQHMRERIDAAPDLFLVAIDKQTGKAAGMLNGLATDEDEFEDDFFTDITMYDPEGKNIMLLGLAVLPEYRHKGLARELVNIYADRERKKGREKLILTCLEFRVPMYESFGFVDDGISASTWGGEQWHVMTYYL